MDCPGAKDHLPGRVDGMRPAVQQEIDAGAARAGERQLNDLCLGQDSQVP
jgi:hypothetical protein